MDFFLLPSTLTQDKARRLNVLPAQRQYDTATLVGETQWRSSERSSTTRTCRWPLSPDKHLPRAPATAPPRARPRPPELAADIPALARATPHLLTRASPLRRAACPCCGRTALALSAPASWSGARRRPPHARSAPSSPPASASLWSAPELIVRPASALAPG